jgi:hypothetical protein
MKNNGADNFRGLLFEPTYEQEVIILFGMLIPYLKDSFIIDKYPDTFPDCFARRNGQEIGIEFEVKASHFYEHHHDTNANLKKCNLLICWENDIPRKTTTRGDIELLKPETIKGHSIEIMALKKFYEEKSLKLILDGKRPGVERANKERFFEQLKENVDAKKQSWINELYDQVNQRKEDFAVKWGGGERLSTMRFFVKRWNVDPIYIEGSGRVWLIYQGNPAISPWKLPQEVRTMLQQRFKHPKPTWYTIPLDTQSDLDNIKWAFEILAEYSRHSDII